MAAHLTIRYSSAPLPVEFAPNMPKPAREAVFEYWHEATAGEKRRTLTDVRRIASSSDVARALQQLIKAGASAQLVNDVMYHALGLRLDPHPFVSGARSSSAVRSAAATVF